MEESALQRITTEIIDGLRGAHADALYLSLHGALIGSQTLQADLALLKAARDALGARPLAVSFDLHANPETVLSAFGLAGVSLPESLERQSGWLWFGGGLALYKDDGTSAHNKILVGAIGVSGDSSCADHNIGWRVRKLLGLDHLDGVGGVSGDPKRPDNIIFFKHVAFKKS